MSPRRRSRRLRAGWRAERAAGPAGAPPGLLCCPSRHRGRGYGSRLVRSVLALTLAVAAAPRWTPAAELAARVASYTIDATLDPADRAISGSAVLLWRNSSRAAVGELFIHLYLNAFANNRTSLMNGMREDAERFLSRHPDAWGRIDLAAIHIGEQDVSDDLEFVSPDDGNPNDRTLARLALPRPVRPGDTIEVRFDFNARLPRLFVRSGHAAPFFFVAQWFPKVAVYKEGRWHAHQYHAASEFFADFGVYDVTLTVPSEYVLGYTGVARGERDNGDGTKTVTVHAEDVHDFAWTADPRFQVVEDRINEVPVRLLLQPHHRGQARRHLHALRAAMTRYAAWFGPYPYPALTVVDPGPGGLAAGGMEYPMLITVGTAWWMPAGLRFPEAVTIHEFGHQYWYGMVATDEVNEAWLDEGINSYVEGLIMDDTYGAEHSYVDLFGLGVGAVPLQRYAYLAAGEWDPIDKASFAMLDRRSYQSTVYAKTALALLSVDRMLGGDRLLAALGEYFRAWRFRHPSGRDVRQLIDEQVDEDLAPLFSQLFDGTGMLDYAVARIDVREVPPLQPFAQTETERARAAEPRRYRTEVVVERRGEVRMPVDILVLFDDGSQTRESWDGLDRWYRIDITSTQRAAYAVVDPDDKLPLDADRLNNSRLRTPGTRGIIRLAGRWGLWLQGALLALSGF
jgi:Peptidase family M1 domain